MNHFRATKVIGSTLLLVAMCSNLASAVQADTFEVVIDPPVNGTLHLEHHVQRHPAER